jgi:hypothetical protein
MSSKRGSGLRLRLVGEDFPPDSKRHGLHPTPNTQGQNRRHADIRCWMLDVGCWVLGVGCWVLGVGCWVLGVGCWVFSLFDGRNGADENAIYFFGPDGVPRVTNVTNPRSALSAQSTDNFGVHLPCNRRNCSQAAMRFLGVRPSRPQQATPGWRLGIAPTTPQAPDVAAPGDGRTPIGCGSAALRSLCIKTHS